jgi:hypothetical protein
MGRATETWPRSRAPYLGWAGLVCHTSMPPFSPIGPISGRIRLQQNLLPDTDTAHDDSEINKTLFGVIMSTLLPIALSMRLLLY